MTYLQYDYNLKILKSQQIITKIYVKYEICNIRIFAICGVVGRQVVQCAFWYSREEGKEASNIAWEGGRNLKKRTQREGGNIRGERIKKKVGRVKFTRPCR